MGMNLNFLVMRQYESAGNMAHVKRMEHYF